MKYLVLIFTTSFLLGCVKNSQSISEYQEVDYLQWSEEKFLATDAVQQAEIAVQSQDFRVFSAMGVGYYYPGIDHESGKRIEEFYGSMGCDTGTDIVENTRQEVARTFAHTYNITLLKLLKERGLVNQLKQKNKPVEANVLDSGNSAEE